MRRKVAALGKDLFPTFIDGQLGYVNRHGEPQFTSEIPFDRETVRIRLSATEALDYPTAVSELIFNDGLAVIERSRGFLPTSHDKNFEVINTSGETIFKRKANWMGTFSEGLAQVALHKKFLIFTIGQEFGYVDKNGDFAISPEFEYAAPFSEGLAFVRIKDRFGFIDQSGKLVIPPHFQQAHSFSEGLAAVQFQDKFGYIDTTGNWVIQPQYDRAWMFSEKPRTGIQGWRLLLC